MSTLVDLAVGQFIQAGDYRLHYHEAGQGSPVILLHGGGPGATGWSNYSGNIEEFAKHYRTFLIDMPGFGESDPITDTSQAATTIRARALRDFLDVLGIEKVSFAGNSMGGSVAMAFAVDYPDRVDRLVLMAAAGTLDTITALQPTEGHLRLREAAVNPTTETMRALVDVMLYDPSLMSEEVLEKRVEAARKSPLRETRIGNSAAPHRDQAPELSSIQAPTLLVWGREDRVNPLEIGLLLMREIPDSRLLVLKRCGHWAQLERREEFNHAAIDFFAGN